VVEENAGFHGAAVYLLREAFEGKPEGQDYTWFVEGKEGIFDALDIVDAARASVKPSDRCATIAAHAYHLLYLLRAANVCQGKPAPEGDWNSSWAKQTVTDAEWAELKSLIRDEYVSYRDWFAANRDWSVENAFVATLTVVPHVAFHLGALRQLVLIV